MRKLPEQLTHQLQSNVSALCLRSRRTWPLRGVALKGFTRWQWQALFASEHGPKNPTTRHVLHVLVMHLGKKESAFPGQERIAKFTALSARSVRQHLALAQKAGWLEIRPNKCRGKHGYWNEYFPTIPARLKKYVEPSPSKMSTEVRVEAPATRKSRVANGALRVAQNASTSGIKRSHVWHDVPQNHVFNQDLNKTLNGSEQPKNVVNDFPGVEWAEAIAAGREVGARKPMLSETAKHYMELVKKLRDKKPPKHISDYIAPVIR